MLNFNLFNNKIQPFKIIFYDSKSSVSLQKLVNDRIKVERCIALDAIRPKEMLSNIF